MTDLAVVTKAKGLATYIFTVTEKSPKRFRFTLVARMQNTCLDILDSLHIANEVWIDSKNQRPEELAGNVRRRRDFQQGALCAAKRLDYLLTFSREFGAILPKQQEVAASLLGEVNAMIRGWIRSDKERFGGLE